MIVLGIILIIVSIVAFYYDFDFDDFWAAIFYILIIFGIGFIVAGTENLKSKEKEIKNIEYYNIKSTIIIEDNIPTDTIYTIYYKKK